MSCGVGHRRGLDSVLLRLWCRPAAVALIRPLAWEPPYAVSAALNRKKKEKKEKKKKRSALDVRNSICLSSAYNGITGQISVL